MKQVLILVLLVMNSSAFAANYVCRGSDTSFDGLRHTETTANIQINAGSCWYSVVTKTVPPFSPRVTKWESPQDLPCRPVYSRDTGEIEGFAATIEKTWSTEQFWFSPVRLGKISISYSSTYDCGERGPMVCDGPWYNFEFFDCKTLR